MRTCIITFSRVRDTHGETDPAVTQEPTVNMCSAAPPPHAPMRVPPPPRPSVRSQLERSGGFIALIFKAPLKKKEEKKTVLVLLLLALAVFAFE